MWDATQLEDLRASQSKHVRARGSTSYHTPSNLLFATLVKIGGLTNSFQWKEEVGIGLRGWNESEQRQVAEDLSDVLLSLIALSESCEIDLGKATRSRIQKLNCQHPPTTTADYSTLSNSPVPSPRYASSSGRSNTSLHVKDKTREQDPKYPKPSEKLMCPLLPHHAAASPSGSSQSPAMGPSAEVGRFSNNNSGTSPPRKTKSAESKAASPCSSGSLSARRPCFVRTLSVVAPSQSKNDPEEVGKLFSPTHFDHNLFSPHSTNTNFEIAYGGKGTTEKTQILPPTLAGQRLPADTGSGSSNATHSTVWSVQPSPPVSPLSPNTLKQDFWPMFKMATELSDSEFKDLELTYCVPIGDRMVELVPGGKEIVVPLKGRREFEQMAREAHQNYTKSEKQRRQPGKVEEVKPKSHFGYSGNRPSPNPSPVIPSERQSAFGRSVNSQQTSPVSQSSSRPRRGLTRTLTVTLPKQGWDPVKETDLYSPTHFSHDLFSPHSNKKEIEVEDSSPVLPPSCSKSNLDEEVKKMNDADWNRAADERLKTQEDPPFPVRNRTKAEANEILNKDFDGMIAELETMMPVITEVRFVFLTFLSFL